MPEESAAPPQPPMPVPAVIPSSSSVPAPRNGSSRTWVLVAGTALAMLTLGVLAGMLLKVPTADNSNNSTSSSSTSLSSSAVSTVSSSISSTGALEGDGIVITNLTPNQLVEDGYIVTGRAYLWYFEGSFPVTLTTAGGDTKTFIATAQSDWMVDAFVPFKVEIDLEGLTLGQPAELLFEKDNPSGRPEFDKEFAVEITI